MGSIVDIANIVAMFGAIATFLFGMSTMTDGLEKLSSGYWSISWSVLPATYSKGSFWGPSSPG
ncbi:hypothetical protein M5E87_17135 [Flavonifractor plautii]|nr:hypothetical protein M5E87_17135 [Flavonifractor plautii]